MHRKILIILILVFINTILLAQSKNTPKINLNFRDTPLEVVLKEIQRQTDIEFIYDAHVIMDKKVTCTLHDVPIHEALTSLLKGTNILYQLFPPNSIVFYTHTESNQTLMGIVVDQFNQQGLPQANIAVKGTNRGTATNNSGQFRLENMTTQLCTLMVCYIGYQPLEILADNHDTNPVKIEMEPKPIHTKPITITENRVPNIQFFDTYGKVKFSPIKLKFLPSSPNRDILHVLQMMPGTKNIFDHLDGLYVQGGTPDQNLVLFDNIPVFRAEHLWGYMNAFNPDAVKQVNFYKVGFPCRYGDKLSSVIELEVDVGTNDKVRYNIGANFFNINSHVQLPLSSKLRCALSLRHSLHKIGLHDMYYNFEDYLFLLKRRYRTDLNHEQLFGFYDMIGKASYQFSTENVLSVTLFTTYDKIDITTNNPESEEKIEGKRFEKWMNTGLGLNWTKRCTPGSSLNLNLTWSGYQNEYLYRYRLTADRSHFLPDSTIANLTYDVPVEEFDQFQINQLNFKSNYSLCVNSLYEIDTGVDVVHTKLKHQLPDEHFIVIESIFPMEDKYHLSIDIPANFEAWKHVLYMDNRLKIPKRSEIVAGCRAIYYHPLNRLYFDPRFTFYHHWSSLTLNFKWGHNHQFLHRMSVRSGDFNPMRTSYYWALADERLNPEYAEYRSTGFDLNWNDYQFGMTFYNKKNKNLLFLVPSIFDNFFLFSPTIFEQSEYPSSDMIHIDHGSNVSEGIEFHLQKKTGYLSGWLSYQVGKSAYQFDTINQGQSFLAEYDRTHELNCIMQLSWSHWILSLSTIYATGTPFSTAEHTVFSTPIELDFYAYCDRSVINNNRLPTYNRFDMKLVHRLKIFDSFELEYGCTLFNILNQTNIIDQYYQNHEDMLNSKVTNITDLGRTLFFFCHLAH